MRHLLLIALGVVAAAELAAQPAAAPRRFEVAAWVDHFDFVGCRQDGKLLFDTETAEGNAKILDHVQETGATTILWRNCAGATMRYPSRLESWHGSDPLDKRHVPSNVPLYGWVRYGNARPDILESALARCRERGLRPGVHWPFEENHWAGFTIGGWNLEHPQFWSCTSDGTPWWGRASLGFPEVMRHKLGLFDELLERGAQSVFIDFFRNGGWSPAYEYTEPVKEAYRKQHGAEPPAAADDPQWCRHVAGTVTELLRQMRTHAKANGRQVEILVGIPGIAPLSDRPIITTGADWQTWVREGLVDTVVINSVNFGRDDPYGSTKALYEQVLGVTRGRCKVLCPVSAYNYHNAGVQEYMKATGENFAQVATRLTELAWEVGADGISLECVDYNNYPAAVREALRGLAEGKCKFVKAQ